jgi:hypothetical protein
LAAEKDTKTPILALKRNEALRFYATMAAISSNGLVGLHHGDEIGWAFDPGCTVAIAERFERLGRRCAP